MFTDKEIAQEFLEHAKKEGYEFFLVLSFPRNHSKNFLIKKNSSVEEIKGDITEKQNRRGVNSSMSKEIFVEKINPDSEDLSGTGERKELPSLRLINYLYLINYLEVKDLIFSFFSKKLTELFNKKDGVGVKKIANQIFAENFNYYNLNSDYSDFLKNSLSKNVNFVFDFIKNLDLSQENKKKLLLSINKKQLKSNFNEEQEVNYKDFFGFFDKNIPKDRKALKDFIIKIKKILFSDQERLLKELLVFFDGDEENLKQSVYYFPKIRSQIEKRKMDVSISDKDLFVSIPIVFKFNSLKEDFPNAYLNSSSFNLESFFSNKGNIELPLIMKSFSNALSYNLKRIKGFDMSITKCFDYEIAVELKMNPDKHNKKLLEEFKPDFVNFVEFLFDLIEKNQIHIYSDASMIDETFTPFLESYFLKRDIEASSERKENSIKPLRF